MAKEITFVQRLQNTLTSLLLFFVFHGLCAQDTLYLDQDRKPASFGDHEYYRVVSKDEAGEDRYKETTYNAAGVIQYSSTFDRYHSKKKSEVSYCKYYPSGQLHMQREMRKGKRHGRFLSYWENGTLKREDYYVKGKFTSGTCWDNNGKEVSYYPFEVPAVYPGGMQNINTFIKNSMDPKYNTSRYAGSKVLVKLAILENGKVSDIEIVRGGPVELLVEAVRLVESMPAWTPGRRDGIPIKTKQVLPIVF